MRHDELGADGDRLGDGLGHAVDDEQHAPDGADGSPTTSPTRSQSSAHTAG